MILDSQTDFVYFSSLLKEVDKYKPFWERLQPLLDGYNIKYAFLKDTRDIWCCDYMPIQVGEEDFVQFDYFPDYLLSPRHIAKLSIQDEVLAANSIKAKHVPLIIDGGNVVKSNSTAILTDKVFDENPSKDKFCVINTIKKALKVEEVFFIPKQPYEVTGHADGMVKFLTESDLLVADYSEHSMSYRAKFAKALKQTGFNIIPFPNVYVNEKNKDGDVVAKGVYLNFIQIGKIILFPQFNLPEDELALEKVSELYPTCKVLPVLANEIAEDGGVINCITWNIKASKE